MSEKEDLELRKLRAEVELREAELRNSKRKWRRCRACGGHGVYKGLNDRGRVYIRNCSSCSGRGGYYYYEG